MKVKLNRGQIGKVDGVDVTVKNATRLWKRVAPTWSMVMFHKNEHIDDAQYTKLYLGILKKGGVELAREIYRAGVKNGGHLTFLCYCRNNQFCHTHILIDWLMESFGAGFENVR